MARITPRSVGFALVIFASVVLVWFVFYNREPRYHGQSLTYWEYKSITGTQKEQTEEQEAFRAMGKSAVPYLVRAIEKQDSPLKLWLLKNFGKRLPILNRWLPLTYDYPRNYAAYALGEIGPSASNALPVLIRLKQANSYLDYFPVAAIMKIKGESIDPLIRQLDDPASAQWGKAAYILSQFGTNASAAIPALCLALPSTNRLAAAYAIGFIRSQPEIAVPALMNAIKNGIPFTPTNIQAFGEMNSIWALGEFEVESRSAIPMLRAKLTDAEPMIRQSALQSLWKILPEDERESLVPALLLLMNDSDTNLRSVARVHLNQIDPKAAKNAATK